jgi:hypothetical protein
MTTIFVGAILTGIAAGLVWLAAQAWYSSHPDWKPLPGRRGQWCSTVTPCPVTPEFIAEALTQAEGCLLRFSSIPAANVQTAGATVQIQVRATTSWVDAWGRKVAGLQIRRAVAVGPDLAALCHEVAHLAEAQYGGATDESHVSWTGNGALAAIDAYTAWLKERG